MSWRHAGPCARAKASQDYSRIKTALARYDRQHIVYMVLTLDPSAWTGEGWAGWAGKTPERRADANLDANAITASYLALRDRWRQLAKAMRKRWGDFQYVSTVESHRSGWPHLNVVVVCPAMAADIQEKHKNLQGWGRKSAGREAARLAFGNILQRTGFGYIAFAESALAKEEDGEDRLAAYISKLAGETGTPWDGQARGLIATADDAPVGASVHSIEGQVVGEIAKLSQAPVRAPEHFRRLRSSKGFLPPVEKNEDLTGALFDEKNEPIGRDQGDEMIQAAMRCDTQQAREDLLEQIGHLVDKNQNRIVISNEQGELMRAKQSKMVKKLQRATRILENRDAKQLLAAAIAAKDGFERIEVYERIERELELYELHKEAEKLDKLRPLAMIDEHEAKRLRQARDILRGLMEPENETLVRGYPLCAGLAREIKTEKDVQDFVRVFASGATFSGAPAARYQLGGTYDRHSEHVRERDESLEYFGG